MTRAFATIGALYALSAVGLGAFGAHAIAAWAKAERLEVWNTAAHYLGWQGTALLALAALTASTTRLAPAPKKRLRTAGWLLIFGTLIFSGSLFVLVLSGIGALGAITPIGGVLMILGWGLAASALFQLEDQT
jgi:uncharacterized membrane protein YgdD (TMEM256/DUF423 family)